MVNYRWLLDIMHYICNISIETALRLILLCSKLLCSRQKMCVVRRKLRFCAGGAPYEATARILKSKGTTELGASTKIQWHTRI